VSLVEKAQETLDLKQAAAMEEKLRANRLDLEDFMGQLRQLKKMGSMENLLEMLPGAGQLRDKMKGSMDGSSEEFTSFAKRSEAIIQSMTPQERRHPEILNAGRRRRIARGSGTQVQDVNELLRQFEQARTMVKRMNALQKRLQRRR
jgi:signal recognition particle subunit SRP54